MPSHSTDNLCCAYTRYSPRPSIEDVQSIRVQDDANLRYMGMLGLTLATGGAFSDEEVSARTVTLDKRPGGAAMLAFIAKHKIRHLVTMKVARIFRNTEDGLRWRRKLRKQKVTLHFSDEGGTMFNADTAMGEATFTLALMMASWEPKSTSERTSKAMRFNQANGRLQSGRPPFGQKRGPDKIVFVDGKEKVIKTLVPDVCEEHLGLLMAQLHGEGYSEREIAARLNEQNLKFRGEPVKRSSVVAGLEYVASSPSPYSATQSPSPSARQ